MFKSSFLWLCSLLMLASLLVGCQRHRKVTSSNTPRHVLRVAVEDPSRNFDPRTTRNLSATTVMRMLFEGLMRLDSNDHAVPALAKDVDISDDLLTYVFTLRDGSWSNGDPITAYDFEYSWKKVLDPHFPAPNAFQFYVISGAKAAKEGKLSPDDVGIAALNSNTLVVHLEVPTPNFLDLVAFHSFFPVNQRWDQQFPNWPEQGPVFFVGNGPFVYARAHPDQLDMDKNPLYWDADAVKLDTVELVMVDENTSRQLFEQEELDWIGSPLSTLSQDAIPALRHTNLKIAPSAGTQFFRFNTAVPPFDDVRIRKAFSYALNRQVIVDHILQAGQLPAMALVPPSLGIARTAFFNDNDREEALFLFQEALNSVGITRDAFPLITLTYTNNDRYHKIAQAVQQQWQHAFGIPIRLQQQESKVVYDLLRHGEYQVCIGSWFADTRDSKDFLEVFSRKNNGTNNTGWEDPQYLKLLQEASRESDSLKRDTLLYHAEKLLMDAMPIAPINYFSFAYLQKDYVHDVCVSELGFLDFKHAFVEKQR